MTTEEKKDCSEALIRAMEREELHTGEAAKHLNLNPAYISMIKNPKLWDSLPVKAWERVNDWMLSRDSIGAYVIPEGEEIYKKPEKKITEIMPELAPKEEKAFVEAITQAQEDHRTAKKEPIKEKNGKSVTLMIARKDMELLGERIKILEKGLSVEMANALSERIAKLESQNEVLQKLLIDAENKINGLGGNFFAMQDETISVMIARLNTIEKRLKKTDRPSGIVIFQRNIYKP